MPQQFHQDPTELFTVVGGTYLRERHGSGHQFYERRTDDQRPRGLEIGVATVFAGFCAVALAISLVASTGPAKLVQVAYHAVM